MWRAGAPDTSCQHAPRRGVQVCAADVFRLQGLEVVAHHVCGPGAEQGQEQVACAPPPHMVHQTVLRAGAYCNGSRLPTPHPATRHAPTCAGLQRLGAGLTPVCLEAQAGRERLDHAVDGCSRHEVEYRWSWKRVRKARAHSVLGGALRSLARHICLGSFFKPAPCPHRMLQRPTHLSSR